MSYSAPNRLLLPMRHSIDTLTDSWMSADSVGLTYTWPTANLAIYVPIRIPCAVVIRALWCSVDNSLGSPAGNIDMALYSATGTAVVSATATAVANAITEQVFDVTDTPIAAGRYYIAASLSTTDYVNAWAPAAPIATALGCLAETSAYPLPSTATWTVTQTLDYIPKMGLLLEATVA